MISLSTGERLKISEGLRFIFETESLLTANPATVSRCSVVFVEHKDLGWEPFVQSWLTSLPADFPEYAQDHIYMLFEHTVQPAIDFISQLTDQPLSEIPPIGYINTLCNILMCFILYLVENKTFSDNPTTTPANKTKIHHTRSSSGLSGSSNASEVVFNTESTDIRATLAKVIEEVRLVKTGYYLRNFMASVSFYGFRCGSRRRAGTEINTYKNPKWQFLGF